MTHKIRCVIIDDERHAITLLTNHINSVPNLELVNTYTNPLQALTEITAADNIDIIFLDVEMPHLTGIELARELRGKTRSIIFTSAYQEYAIEAFDVRAIHYLLKPITLAKFTQTVINILENELNDEDEKTKNISFFKTGEKGKLTMVNKQEILYFESAQNYVNMVTEENKQLVYLTLKDVEKIFGNDLFCRVHRSHVININKIQKIVGNTINLGQGHLILMGDAFKSGLMKFLKDKTLLSGRN
ncbi:LytR/AlgR family response regulator transcription factor [Pedobacter agri]|uniref:LytR/AlgR family response regulator transcription factor n=1 Tax=Pedobacter agri TaxID=454586 RepID=UPI00292DB415|nr:LytTR family DNA-binding domain-containing protein [Pedobacter agri]